MKSIFIPGDKNEIIDRINMLTPESKNLWGKMNVSQMLAHCKQPLRVAIGELELKKGLMGILFGSWAKKKLLSPGDFEHNLPTDKSFIIKDERRFETEKSALIALINKISAGGEAGITKKPHPFFGVLTTREWDVLQVKHLDHHLRQFGV